MLLGIVEFPLGISLGVVIGVDIVHIPGGKSLFEEIMNVILLFVFSRSGQSIAHIARYEVL